MLRGDEIAINKREAIKYYKMAIKKGNPSEIFNKLLKYISTF